MSPEFDLTSFENNGFTLIKSAFDPITCEDLATEIESIHSNFPLLKTKFPTLQKLGEWSIKSPNRASQKIQSFIFSQAFQELTRSLIGPNVDLYWNTTAAKPPATGRTFPWHQDCGYGVGPEDYITCWTALDPVDEKNGALRLIPNSHKQGKLPHEYRKSTVADYAGIFLTNPNVPEINAICLSMNPGDILCMSSKLIHASAPNHSNRKRRAIISAYGKAVTAEYDRTEEILPFFRHSV
jgi:ectoine hydroxylase-related dioxygenase (phytanoyl-CoA dioxygenase family)